MTPRGKLTKWDEWEIGSEYESNNLYWEKKTYRLEKTNRKKGWILLAQTSPPSIDLPAVKVYAWRNKFRKK